jgi:hypothetical protein
VIAGDCQTIRRIDDGALIEILANWVFVAAIAWEGSRRQGRGTVVVEEGLASYCPGSICECHRDLVEAYDPDSEAVVALVSRETIRAIHVVTGWPAPPDAALITQGSGSDSLPTDESVRGAPLGGFCGITWTQGLTVCF